MPWILTILLGLPGCGLWSSPFADALDPQQPVTTASVDAARDAQDDTALRHDGRDFEVTNRAVAPGVVTHGPLYWEDPWESPDSESAGQIPRFAYSGEEFLAIAYGAGRFLVNSVAWPLSAVLAPPVADWESDGLTETRVLYGERHDAARKQQASGRGDSS